MTLAESSTKEDSDLSGSAASTTPATLTLSEKKRDCPEKNLKWLLFSHTSISTVYTLLKAHPAGIIHVLHIETWL